jgi:hypothetical protein
LPYSSPECNWVGRGGGEDYCLTRGKALCKLSTVAVLSREGRGGSLLPYSWKSTLQNEYNRTPISWTAFRGRMLISGRFSVRSDLFHRQNVQPLAKLSCKRGLYACLSTPAYRSSTVPSNVCLLGHQHDRKSRAYLEILMGQPRSIHKLDVLCPCADKILQ